MRNLHLFQAQPATVAALLPDFGLRAAAPARAVALRATHVAAGMKNTPFCCGISLERSGNSIGDFSW